MPSFRPIPFCNALVCSSRVLQGNSSTPSSTKFPSHLLCFHIIPRVSFLPSFFPSPAIHTSRELRTSRQHCGGIRPTSTPCDFECMFLDDSWWISRIILSVLLLLGFASAADHNIYLSFLPAIHAASIASYILVAELALPEKKLRLPLTNLKYIRGSCALLSTQVDCHWIRTM